MRQVTLPESIYKILEERAEGKRSTVSDLLCDMVLEYLEFEVRREALVRLSQEFMEEGERLERTGDLVEAGESYWKSLSYIMRAVAELIGFSLENYQDYYSLAEYLAYKFNDGSVVVQFLNAERLHGEFHPRPQGGESFNRRVSDLKALTERLRGFLASLTKSST